MTWKCPTCGFDGNDDSNMVCICGYRDDSTSGAHDNALQLVSKDIAETPVAPATKINISAMKNRTYYCFIIKAIPEVLIATIPAFASITDELLKTKGIKTGILWGSSRTLSFVAIILLTSLIVSAARDEEGWMKHKWPIHCVLIALASPVIAAVWVPFSYNLPIHQPDSVPFWGFVACFLYVCILLPSSLLLGLCVRLIMFPRQMAEK